MEDRKHSIRCEAKMLNKNAANVGTGLVSSANKDVIKLQLVIDEEDEFIQDIVYKVFGSYEAHRSVERLPTLLIGLSFNDIAELTPEDISDDSDVGGLILSAVHAAIHTYIRKKVETDINIEPQPEKYQ